MAEALPELVIHRLCQPRQALTIDKLKRANLTMQALCAEQDLIDGKPRGYTVNGEAYIALRLADSFYVYRNHCPHRGLNLEWVPDQFLDPHGRYLQCATHGALFTLTEGYCVKGPCLGQRLTAVACEPRDGQLWISLPSQ